MKEAGCPCRKQNHDATHRGKFYAPVESCPHIVSPASHLEPALHRLVAAARIKNCKDRLALFRSRCLFVRAVWSTASRFSHDFRMNYDALFYHVVREIIGAPEEVSSIAT